MPADITGTEVIEENRSTGSREFQFLEGPLFANVILADEINRTPPKTQAALLEAMQERQVTVGRVRHKLRRSVLRAGHAEPDRAGRHLPAARSAAGPLHVQGVREVSELQRGVRDRPPHDHRCMSDDIAPVLTGEQILELQRLVRKVPVTDHVIHYTLALVRQTRVGEPGVPEFVNDWLSWGAGPRAVQYLILGGKARALLHGRTHVPTEDIQALASPCCGTAS